jgi:predicted RNA binding protein YcfA (HicA-like mRNA interferase family)
MPKKPIKTRHLIRVLQQLGFKVIKNKGSHTIFMHPNDGLLISIPEGRDEIPSVYLRSIERQISNYKIISDDKWQKLLYSEAKQG